MTSYRFLQELISIHSPTGFTEKACDYIFQTLQSMGWKPEMTNKGAVRCSLGDTPTLAIAAHTDTLGAIVSGIRSDGTLAISQIGGWPFNNFEGEYVTVITLDGREITGSLLLNNPSVHASNVTGSMERKSENMHIRLDEEVENADQVRTLGIENGDIVCFDTRYVELPSGFIKSRFMDNKAGCFVLLELARLMKESGRSLPVELFFSNYEEVGHGASGGFSPAVRDLLVIDMGVLGKGCEGNEMSCSICAKDSSGPYDYSFRKKLVGLARKNRIAYKVDVYPFYGSDGSAALRAGNDFRVALIGPGVAASHGMERTHKKGIEATLQLCMAYLQSEFPGSFSS
jgi:putative aminopeptidase FrvX